MHRDTQQHVTALEQYPEALDIGFSCMHRTNSYIHGITGVFSFPPGKRFCVPPWLRYRQPPTETHQSRPPRSCKGKPARLTAVKLQREETLRSQLGAQRARYSEKWPQASPFLSEAKTPPKWTGLGKKPQEC